jgi:hypothetical protein
VTGLPGIIFKVLCDNLSLQIDVRVFQVEAIQKKSYLSDMYWGGPAKLYDSSPSVIRSLLECVCVCDLDCPEIRTTTDR